MANSTNDTTPPSPTTVTVDMAQLASLIAATVKQTLDSQRGNASEDSLGQTIGQAVADGMAKHSRPKVAYGSYIKKVHSSTHPDPAFPDGPPLKKDVMINGLTQERHQLTDTEINLFNRLSRTGRYIDRLVEVICRHDGIEIRYNDSTTDQRNTNSSKWRHTVDMLEQIVTAMDAENEEDDALRAEANERQQARIQAKAVKEEKASHGTFGNNKAFREAKEKNG